MLIAVTRRHGDGTSITDDALNASAGKRDLNRNGCLTKTRLLPGLMGTQ